MYPEKQITFKGKTQTIKMWAETLNIKTSTLRNRLLIWDKEKALTTPCKKHAGGNFRLITVGGQTLPIGKWAEKLNMNYRSLKYLIDKYGENIIKEKLNA